MNKIKNKTPCLCCGKIFSGKRGKFCSEECTKKHHYQTHKKEYLKRIKDWQNDNKEKRRKTTREWSRRFNEYYKPNQCKKCGKEIIRDTYRRKEFCYECRVFLIKNRQNKRATIYFKAKKELVLDLLGNRCKVCGFNRTLEVHHINERKGIRKDGAQNYLNQISKGEPLVLLCPNHHVLLHKRLLKKEELKLIKDAINT